jgi:hypothetical protein
MLTSRAVSLWNSLTQCRLPIADSVEECRKTCREKAPQVCSRFVDGVCSCSPVALVTKALSGFRLYNDIFREEVEGAPIVIDINDSADAEKAIGVALDDTDGTIYTMVGSSLFKVDFEKHELVKFKEIKIAMSSIAINKGKMYGVGFDGLLYEIDKGEGTTKELGNPGIHRVRDLAFNSKHDLYASAQGQILLKIVFSKKLQSVEFVGYIHEANKFGAKEEIFWAMMFGYGDDILYATTNTAASPLFKMDSLKTCSLKAEQVVAAQGSDVIIVGDGDPLNVILGGVFGCPAYK